MKTPLAQRSLWVQALLLSGALACLSATTAWAQDAAALLSATGAAADTGVGNLNLGSPAAQAAMMDETSFDWIAIRQVPREFNERADSITKEVLLRKSGFSRA